MLVDWRLKVASEIHLPSCEAGFVGVMSLSASIFDSENVNIDLIVYKASKARA